MSDQNPNVITVETVVDAPIEKVWAHWNEPEHIVGWAFASDDWQATDPVNDLRPGGEFSTHMSAKDGSAAFDFAGVYTAIQPHELIEYDLGDGRHVKTVFAPTPNGVAITQSFDAENEYPLEVQQQGWQAFLDNFKRYTEAR
jgi:uncharacterized protein YndB with AHSA1/START domain